MIKNLIHTYAWIAKFLFVKIPFKAYEKNTLDRISVNFAKFINSFLSIDKAKEILAEC